VDRPPGFPAAYNSYTRLIDPDSNAINPDLRKAFRSDV